MKNLAGQMALPFAIWLLLIGPPAAAQTPAPAPLTPFSLPLTDGTNANAQVLPIADGRAWLVYATNSGGLGTYYLTPTGPIPPPDPIPPIPPPPQRLTIAIVENPATTTQKQRSVLSDSTWRKSASSKHDFLGIIPNDVVDKRTGQPPPRLAPFLDRASKHNLPWIIFTDAKGVIIWEGQVPTTARELIDLIERYGD